VEIPTARKALGDHCAGKADTAAWMANVIGGKGKRRVPIAHGNYVILRGLTLLEVRERELDEVRGFIGERVQ
jgi:hypothetical protein